VGTGSGTAPAIGHVIDLTEATLPGLAGSGDVQATVSVGGDLDGQVAIGNNIVQVRIDTMHGDLITAAPASSAPVVRRRRSPARLLPRRPVAFVDRVDETERLVASLRAADAIEVVGPPGSGRSTLLRQVAHDPRLATLPSGVVHLSCGGEGAADTARSLFDVFYETSSPYQPSRGELRHRLAEVDAALLLDDVALSTDEATHLLDLVPRSGVVLVTDASVLASSLPLGPLPPADAARMVRTASAAVGATTAAPDPAAGATPQAQLRTAAEVTGGALGEDGRRVLGLLAAVPGLRLDDGQLAELGIAGGVPEHVETAVAELHARGLVLRHGSRRGAPERVGAVASAVATTLPADVLDEGRRRVVARFRAWARAHRHTVRVPENEADAARQVLGDAVQREDWGAAVALGLALESTYAVSGRWTAWRTTLAWLDLAASRLAAADVLAFARHQSGVLEICEGRVAAGAALLEEALRIRERIGDDAGAAVTRANLRLFRPPPPPPPPAPTPPAPGPWLALTIVALVAVGGALAWLMATDTWPFEAEPIAEGDGEEVAVPPDGPPPPTEPTPNDPEPTEPPPNDPEPTEAPPSDPEPDPPEPEPTPPPEPGRRPEGPTDPPVTRVPVPDVVGQYEEDATRRLEEAGLIASPREAGENETAADGSEDGPVLAGTVVRQTPAAGEAVPTGSEVRLVVVAEDAVVVPDVLGLPLDLALDRLAAAELKAAPVATAEPGDACEVVDQDPAPRTIVRPGAPVEVRYVDDDAEDC
jgi:hypothetical protein